MDGDLGMFGSPIGYYRGAEEDLMKAQQMNQLGQAAMVPSKIKEQNATARFHEAEAGKLEHELEIERIMAQRMAQSATGGTPKSPADYMDELSQVAAGAGSFTRAADFAAKGALIRSRNARAEAQQAETRGKQIDAYVKDMQLQGRVFGEVGSPEAWAQANELYKFQTGKPSPYANVEYTPELAAKIKDDSMSAVEKANQTRLSENARALANYRRSRLDQIDTQNDLRDERLDLERQREARLAKTSKGVSAPATAEVDQAKRLIKKDFGEDMPDLKEAAFSIAAEARALRRQNPALTADQALQRAYFSAKQSGDFQTENNAIMPNKTKYIGGGKTAASPAPLPMDGSKVAAGKLIKGRFYTSPTGVTGKWNGKGFDVVEADGGGGLDDENDEAGDEADDGED